MTETTTRTWFPGGTAVTQLRVYDWPAADGLRGGSPHLHTASTEGYVVLRGSGTLETLSGAGYVEHPLEPGTLLWFTPGTVHRLVAASPELEILVVMQNAGLPEAGDAVLTFPPSVLASPTAYTAAAKLPELADVEAGPQSDDPHVVAARRRRDLAIEGYLALRASVQAEGPTALAPLYEAAARLVRDKAIGWQALWRERVLASAERTAEHLALLASGHPDHLAESAVMAADQTSAVPTWGMCGRLTTWDLEGAQ